MVLFPPRITGQPQIAYEATSTHFSGGSFPGIESGVWRDLTTDKDFIDGKAAVFTGSTWGYVSEGQETYTDSQGYYSFNDLEPGLYNLTVFHEDESLQTISYQVAGTRDAITQTVALKGIPELVLEASGEKDGNCTLVWSQKTISEADVGSNATMLKGVGLGFGSTMLGKKAAMLCTASGEEVIDEHYLDQIKQLEGDEKKLKEKIIKFRKDELHHKDIAYKEGATKKGIYSILDKIIKTGSKIAISISEKV